MPHNNICLFRLHMRSTFNQCNILYLQRRETGQHLSQVFIIRTIAHGHTLLINQREYKSLNCICFNLQILLFLFTKKPDFLATTFL
nr:hypothetical protein Iba_chr04aCG0800 [Ipomoea batatas]GMC81175.1 hypothetical protein Iba_chr04bCG1540 [Ipomoea batatas]GMC87418.1 hypothetical protein Iba_chr04eCG0290 [Ipomoea batatas]